MNCEEFSTAESFNAVITGTHSSGKSTLLKDLTLGKLRDLGIRDEEYEDFGYGVVTDSKEDKSMPLLLIPEAARRLVDLYHRPDLITENYSLGFQINIDFDVIARFHAANELALTMLRKLVDFGIVDPNRGVTKPVILSDRGPLDGCIYSYFRYLGQNTDVINGSARTGFMVEWLRSFIDFVFITDHTEVPFEQDSARLDDIEFRDQVAKSIAINYQAFFDQNSIATLHGDQQSRKSQLVETLFDKLSDKKIKYTQLPYRLWTGVRIRPTEAVK